MDYKLKSSFPFCNLLPANWQVLEQGTLPPGCLGNRSLRVAASADQAKPAPQCILSEYIWACFSCSQQKGGEESVLGSFVQLGFGSEGHRRGLELPLGLLTRGSPLVASLYTFERLPVLAACSSMTHAPLWDNSRLGHLPVKSLASNTVWCSALPQHQGPATF